MPDERQGPSNACDIVEEVNERSIYKTRIPEGKAGRGLYLPTGQGGPVRYETSIFMHSDDSYIIHFESLIPKSTLA